MDCPGSLAEYRGFHQPMLGLGQLSIEGAKMTHWVNMSGHPASEIRVWKKIDKQHSLKFTMPRFYAEQRVGVEVVPLPNFGQNGQAMIKHLKKFAGTIMIPGNQ